MTRPIDMYLSKQDSYSKDSSIRTGIDNFDPQNIRTAINDFNPYKAQAEEFLEEISPYYTDKSYTKLHWFSLNKLVTIK